MLVASTFPSDIPFVNLREMELSVTAQDIVV